MWLAAGAGVVLRERGVGFEKWRVRGAEGSVLISQLFIVRGDVACIFFGGETQLENFRKFHGFGSFQSGVHSVPVAGDTTRKVGVGRCWDR